MSIERSGGLTRRDFLKGATGLLLVLSACSEDNLSQRQKPRVTHVIPESTTVPSTLPPTTTTTIEKRLSAPLPSFIRSGPADKPFVALTVDDIFGASGGQSLEQLLNIAQEKGIHFTFFPTGEAMEISIANGTQEIWRRAVREGHEIGNHTYNHNRNLPRVPDDVIRYELNSLQEKLNEVLGFEYKMRLMRPPGGNGGFEQGGNPRIMQVLQELGYSMVMWTIDSNGTDGHLGYQNAIMNQKGVGSGSIILNHFTQLSPSDIGMLVDRLRERGLEPKTITEMFTE